MLVRFFCDLVLVVCSVFTFFIFLWALFHNFSRKSIIKLPYIAIILLKDFCSSLLQSDSHMFRRIPRTLPEALFFLLLFHSVSYSITFSWLLLDLNRSNWISPLKRSLGTLIRMFVWLLGSSRIGFILNFFGKTDSAFSSHFTNCSAWLALFICFQYVCFLEFKVWFQ